MWNVFFSTGILYLIYLQIGGCVFLVLEIVNELDIKHKGRSDESQNFTRKF